MFLGMFGFLQQAKAANTFSVVYDTQKAGYYNAVVKGADHLLSQQNSDGGWQWQWTGGGPSDRNNFGISALGLLDAYQLTHKASYLTGATLTAEHLVGVPTPTDLDTDNANRFYSSDIEFLAKIAQVTGNTAYSDKATALMNHFMTQPNRYCATGCVTAQDIADTYHGWYPAPSGIGVWQISGWVLAAKLTGETTWGTALANIVKADVLDSAYDRSLNLTQDTYYSLGLASALESTALFPTANSDIKTKLVIEQDGTTGAITANSNDGVKQTTAYAVLGLSAAGDLSGAMASVNSFVGTNQNFDGGWTESNSTEFTEVNSEIIQAIASVLPANTFYTIQDAVNAASSGDTINVGAGTYTENVTISKSLSLQGSTGANLTGYITITSDDVTVKGMNITNPSGNFGILATDHSNLTFSNNTIHDIGSSLIEGSAQAIAVISSAADVSTINIENNTISNIGNTSMVHAGSAGSSAKGVYLGNSTGTKITSNVIISGNTINNIYASTADWIGSSGGYHGGAGAYGLLVNHKTTGLQVTNNTIGTLEGLWAHAIGLEKDTPNAVVTGNTISGLTDHKGGTDKVAVFFESNPSGSTVMVNYNNFNGTFYGVAIHPDDATAYGYTVNATHNWWGTADLTAIADMIYGSVDVSNPIDDQQLILDEDTSMDTSHTEVVVGDNSNDSTVTIPETVTEPTINFAALLETSGDNKIVTTTAELTIDSATGSSGSVNVTLPAGLVITGDSSWNGVINAPTNKITEFILQGGDVSAAIEVGLTNQSLTFNKAVRLLFAGKTGKKVGYDPGNGFYPITTVCTADDQATVDAQLSGNSECKFDNGTDIIVWTKHFTTFATYAPAVVSSGGGGGGSSYVPPTPSVPVAVNPVVPPVVVPTVPQGQVLGETLINSHPDGTFISIGKAIYIVSAGKKRPFATFSEFQSYGKVSVIKASEADQLLPEGDIIRAKSGTIATDLKDRRTIYLINEKGEKQGFATYSAFTKMKYKLSQVKRLDLSVYPTGEVIN